LLAIGQELGHSFAGIIGIVTPQMNSGCLENLRSIDARKLR
jgi:hypothetical protein